MNDIKTQKELDITNLNERIPNSFLAGKSVIAVLSEHCTRLQDKIGNTDYEELVVEFGDKVKIVGEELLRVSQDRLLFAKKWVKTAISDLDFMQCKIECSL